MKTNSRAALEAAKLERTKAITAVDTAAVHAAAGAASWDLSEVQVRDLKERRGAAVMSAKPAAVASIVSAIAHAEIELEIAAAKAAASTAIHASAVTELHQAEAVVEAAVDAAFDDELRALAARFVQALDDALALGSQLRLLSGADLLHQPVNAPRMQLPAEVVSALTRLPLRDQLRVPVDVLRGAGEISNARAQRLAELRAA